VTCGDTLTSAGAAHQQTSPPAHCCGEIATDRLRHVGGAQVATDSESTNQLQLAPGVATGQPADVTSLLSIAAHPRTVRCLLQRSAPIQLAQCRFHAWQAISNAKILILFFKWNIRKQFYQTALSETVMVWNYQNADCSLKRKFYLYFFLIFGKHSFLIAVQLVDLITQKVNQTSCSENMSSCSCELHRRFIVKNLFQFYNI